MAGFSWFLDGTYSRKQLRQLAAAWLGGNAPARPLGARSGVTPGVTSSILTVSPTTWTLTPFTGVLDVETSADMGPSPFVFDTNQTGSVTAANATNPRIDLLSLTMNDASSMQPTIVYSAGTAAASPTAPATPANSIALARINVPAAGGGSPTFTWVAPYCSAAVSPARAQYSQTTLNNLLSADYKQLTNFAADNNTLGISYSGGNFTIPATWTGSLKISGRSSFAGQNAGDLIAVKITLNGSTVHAEASAAQGATSTVVLGDYEITPSPGDVLAIWAYVPRSSCTTVISGGYTPFIRFERVY